MPKGHKNRLDFSREMTELELEREEARLDGDHKRAHELSLALGELRRMMERDDGV